jgi:hypothetical protein
MWERMRTGLAAKGIRDYYWAMTGITPDDTPESQEGGHGFLGAPPAPLHQNVIYLLCWSPRPGPAGEANLRSRRPVKIEEDQLLAKQVSGLDSGQVTTWTSWRHWTAISLLRRCYTPRG